MREEFAEILDQVNPACTASSSHFVIHTHMWNSPPFPDPLADFITAVSESGTDSVRCQSTCTHGSLQFRSSYAPPLPQGKHASKRFLAMDACCKSTTERVKFVF